MGLVLILYVSAKLNLYQNKLPFRKITIQETDIFSSPTRSGETASECYFCLIILQNEDPSQHRPGLWSGVAQSALSGSNNK